MRLGRLARINVTEKLRFRPEVMRLESREVPGQTTGVSMLWATGVAAAGVAAGQARAEVARARDLFTPSVGDDTTSLSVGGASDDYWAAQTVRNFGAAWDSGLADEALSGSGIQLDDGFASVAPMAPRGTGFESFSEHAVAGSPNPVAPLTVGGTPSIAFGSAAPEFGALDAVAGGMFDAAPGVDAGGATPMLTKRMVNPMAAATPYTPAQVRHAYGFDQLTQTGAGQTIYIIIAFDNPNIASDLHTFDTQWGLPDPNLTVHKMSKRVRGNTSWGFESSLDVQWSHAIAPQANIVLVEATSNSNSALYAAVDWATNQGAKVVSMSWGGGDASGESANDTHFNHPNVAYVAASGDTGAQVIYPSASPYVLSVGGTNLQLDSSGNRIAAETAWSSGGGGASLYESRPGYQTSYGITTSGRATPDVSYNADPNTGVYVYDTFTTQPGWYQVGGTSAGAPQWAGLIALVDQTRLTPLSTQSLTSRFSYSAATGAAYGLNYTDITSGSNGYSAGTGYDLATGVGSPKANALVPWLIAN